MHKYLAAIALISFLVCSRAAADDTAINKVGGTITVMHEHPGIRLVAEHVRVVVHRKSAEVECAFTLRNEGPRTTATMGFPDFSDQSLGHFDNFESRVNGQKVSVELVKQSEDEYWWTKSVLFEQGETKEISDRYTGGISFNTGRTLWFSYILYTGASWSGNIGSADIVVHFADFDLDQIKKTTPAGYSTGKSEIIWALKDFEPERERELAEIKIEWKDTPQTRIDSEFHRAAALGDIPSVKRLLESGVRVDSLGDYQLTALRLAIRYAAGPKLIAFLLDNSANPNESRDGWDTPLDEAVRQNCDSIVDVIRVLLDHGADVTGRVGPRNGQVALALAMASPCPSEVVELLIARGADGNASGGGGATALHLGCLSDVSQEQPTPELAHKLAYEKIKIVLAHGADPNVLDDQGHTPLDYAKTEEIRHLLAEHGALSGREIISKQAK